MKKTESKEVALAPSQESLSALEQMFPKENGYDKIYLPRLEYVSQDKFEGTGKNAKCVTEAGTYFINKESNEKGEDGKIVWTKEEVGAQLNATIVYQRKQLKMWDATAEQWSSTPIYDEDTEIIPLFFQGVKIKEGTPAELKKMYEYVEEGKTKTKLQDNKVLYVLYNGEMYQMTLKGSSMYAFKTFARKTTLLPAQLTSLSADEMMTQGTNNWKPMKFEKNRDLNAEEVNDVLSRVASVKKAINDEKAYYAKEKKLDETKIVYPTDPNADGSSFDLTIPVIE